MKVKEIARTANIAWSPASHHPIYLAAGTAAQQLDATFSTTAALEIFALDLTSGDREMPVKGKLSSEHRFNKLVWGTYGMEKEETPNGILVGGTDSGDLVMWNPLKILNGEIEDAVLFQSDKHTGAVQALDLNPFQPNLIASGASDSEIYVWDLKSPDNPHSPGAKSLPPDNISCLGWNRQVTHILASTSPCGRCVVWDLRKNEPIIKVSDQGSMARLKAIEWHPEVATQMVLASEDDRCPVIQMWDLRYATSPMKVLERHQRGVLSIAWCPQDPELLMSCGKDSRILCWNPSSNDPRGEVVYELPCPAQWSFDVKWCPRNPNMISTPSFDGHISVYSLMGGGVADHSGIDQKMVNDAFNINDPFASSVQHQPSEQVPVAATLKKPPKWLRRPCGASFGFGGKLISFGKTAEAPISKVNVSQVVTEEDLVNRSNLLEGALASASFAEFCRTKIESGSEGLDSTLWNFLKVNFEGEPRKQFLTLLGYDPNNLAKKIAAKMGDMPSTTQGVDAAVLAQKIKHLQLPSSTGESGSSDSADIFSGGALTPSVPDDQAKTPVTDGMDASLVFDAISSGTLDTSGDGGEIRITTPFSIPTDDESDGLISQALLTGNFEAAVEVCFHCDRMADAFLLAIAGGPELLKKTQQLYFQKKKTNLKRLMSVVVNRDWPDVVKSCSLENWREALAILVTYAKPEEFAPLCDLLGQRLEAQQDENNANAMVCYICAGNVEKFVSCWSKTMPSEPSPLELQNLIEKVMILKKAVEKERRQVVQATNSNVSEMLCKYAGILASQGSVEIAMEYLMAANDQEDVAILRDRLYHAQYPSHVTSSIKPPSFPFPRVDVKAAPAVQPEQQPTQAQSSFAPPQAQENAGGQQPSQGSGFYNPGSYNPTQVPPSHAPISLPGQHQFPPTPYYHGNQPPSQANVGYPSQPNPSYGGNPPPISQGAAPMSNQSPSPVRYNAPPPPAPGSQTGYPSTAPIPGYGMSNTPGAPNSYPPPQPGQLNQPHAEYSPPTSTWSADGTHAIAKKHQPTHYTPPAPITMPIFNSAEQQPGQTGNPAGGATSMVPPGSGVPPGAPGPVQNTPVEKEPEPVKEVIKGPIPAEHISLQEAFDGLIAKCRGTAMNQQTKKKLDDVTKKLGALYDKLREQKLSPSILDGLHKIAQACQAADYANGYQAYTNLISSGSFSEISTFMPGIKTLMQVATQLRV
ncbi:protein transport protein Sec31A-like [Dendronephthya gigantea]|uniref:protein transport protein Sec31A-like n=1 Tax=Dendronephthya gigantea TaxID=151771 RepID=UPI00106B5030|nr:protein transport protein Sec31A-like [Dendronephthya gigantea]